MHACSCKTMFAAAKVPSAVSKLCSCLSRIVVSTANATWHPHLDFCDHFLTLDAGFSNAIFNQYPIVLLLHSWKKTGQLLQAFLFFSIILFFLQTFPSILSPIYCAKDLTENWILHGLYCSYSLKRCRWCVLILGQCIQNLSRSPFISGSEKAGHLYSLSTILLKERNYRFFPSGWIEIEYFN